MDKFDSMIQGLGYHDMVQLRKALNQMLRTREPPTTHCVSCATTFTPSKHRPTHQLCTDCTQERRKRAVRETNRRYRNNPENKEKYQQWIAANYKS